MRSHRNRQQAVLAVARPASALAAPAFIATLLLAIFTMFGPALPAAEAAPKYKRIVALTPFAGNAMAQMGVFPKALGQTLGGDRRYVSGLRSTPRLAMSHPRGPNMERLARLRPDLIFTSPQWSAGKEFMDGIAKRVVVVDPKSVSEARKKVRLIARLVGRKARGERLVRQMNRSIRRNSRNIKSNPSVMVVLGVGSTPWSFLGDSWGGEIVRMAGGRLRTGGAPGRGFARISNELVLAEDPDVIIVVPHARQDEITQEMKDNLKAQWAGARAAENGRIVFSEDNSLLQAGTDIGRTIKKVRNILRN
ncbi:MAG: ABC transporter substrate-binding protein [Solirubrobacterales bacterium]|jgi:iron complex transport system substrate-binding protein